MFQSEILSVSDAELSLYSVCSNAVVSPTSVVVSCTGAGASLKRGFDLPRVPPEVACIRKAPRGVVAKHKGFPAFIH